MPAASTSMFVRRLVSGVRSSCDASATSWRCERSASASASSIVLKLAPRRLSSSVPSARIRRLRSRVRATCSAASVSCFTGVSAARATSRPSHTASAMPPRLISASANPRSRSVLSTSSSGRTAWSASPGRQRRRVDARMDAADRRVAEEGLALARAPPRGPADRPAAGNVLRGAGRPCRRVARPGRTRRGCRAARSAARARRRPAGAPGSSSPCGIEICSNRLRRRLSTSSRSWFRTTRNAATEASTTATATAAADSRISRRRKDERPTRARRRAIRPACHAGRPAHHSSRST